METNQSGFFRRKEGYTSIQNVIVRDASISLKAKGLYLVIQANITNPYKKYSKDDFKNMTLEGEKAFDGAWKELKEAGYLKIHNFPNGQKNKFIIEFELLDAPKPGPHTFYYNKNGEQTATNAEHRERCIQSKEDKTPGYHLGLPQNGVPANGVPADGVPADRVSANGVSANGVSANGEVKGINTIDKDLNNDNLSLTHKDIRDGESEFSEAVVVSEDEVLIRGDIEEVEIEAYEGINYELANETEFMKKIVMTLVNWNELIGDCIDDEGYLQIYVQIVECLTQMATTLKPAVYKGSHVSYKHVIDRMNIYIAKNKRVEGAMFMWTVELAKLVNNALRHNSVSNVRLYIKSMIWDHLETQQMRYAALNATNLR